MPESDRRHPPTRTPTPARRALPYALALTASVAGGLALIGALAIARFTLFPVQMTDTHRDMLTAAWWSLLCLPVGVAAWFAAKRTALPPRPGRQWRLHTPNAEDMARLARIDADRAALAARRAELEDQRAGLLGLAEAAGVVPGPADFTAEELAGLDVERTIADVRAAMADSADSVTAARQARRPGVAVYPPRRAAELVAAEDPK